MDSWAISLLAKTQFAELRNWQKVSDLTRVAFFNSWVTLSWRYHNRYHIAISCAGYCTLISPLSLSNYPLSIKFLSPALNWLVYSKNNINTVKIPLHFRPSLKKAFSFVPRSSRWLPLLMWPLIVELCDKGFDFPPSRKGLHQRRLCNWMISWPGFSLLGGPESGVIGWEFGAMG